MTTQSKTTLILDEYIVSNDKHLKSDRKKIRQHTTYNFNESVTIHLKKLDTTADDFANADLESTN